MERGLLWLPLLILFIWLAWAGWNEFQKVESYRAWSEDFRSSKFDIYSVLGLEEAALVIGKPSRKGPVDLKRVAFAQIQAVALRLDGKAMAWEEAEAIANPTEGNASDRNPSSKRKGGSLPKAIAIELDLGGDKLQIPFTQLDLALDWTKRLKQELMAEKE